jgi:hypothetical protein
LAGGGAGSPDRILRVGLVAKTNNDNLPDGPAFHCRFEVAPGASPQAVPLSHSPEGSTPDGMSVGLNGGTGTITIE